MGSAGSGDKRHLRGRGDRLQRGLRAQVNVQRAADMIRTAMVTFDPEPGGEVDAAFLKAVDAVDKLRIQLAPIVRGRQEAS